MKKIFFLTLVVSISLCSSCTKAEPKQVSEMSSKFVQEKIADNLYVLKAPNYHTNVGVFISTDAILLIDPMTGFDNHQNLLDAIKKLSDNPIKYVLNTHSHGDHSGANKFFSELGATIVSHENAKYSNAIYDVTFKDTYTIEMDNESINLFHIAAHTIDDALIYFKKNNVVFMGDSYMTNTYPFYFGGGGVGHISILDKALSLGNEKTIIVPAHGKLSSNKEELENYKENSMNWIERIRALYSKGNTIDEIILDSQIKKLSIAFNKTQNISIERLKNMIEKSISADLIKGISISANTLINYEGSYHYDNGKTDEIIFLDEKLFLRSQGYMYELVPLSKIKFHIRGEAPLRHVIFRLEDNELIYFNGRENRRARKE